MESIEPDTVEGLSINGVNWIKHSSRPVKQWNWSNQTQQQADKAME
jgi:hypothetical protein